MHIIIWYPMFEIIKYFIDLIENFSNSCFEVYFVYEYEII